MFEPTFGYEDSYSEVMTCYCAKVATARAKQDPLEPPFVVPTPAEAAQDVDFVVRRRMVATKRDGEEMRLTATDFAACVAEVQGLAATRRRGKTAPTTAKAPTTSKTPSVPVVAPVAKVAPDAPVLAAPHVAAKADQNTARRAQMAKAAAAEMQVALASGAASAITKGEARTLEKRARIVAIR